MDFNFRKMTETERKNVKKQNFTEVKGKITEQHLKNEIIKLINRYIERGYSEEEISQMTFYRYPTKVKRK